MSINISTNTVRSGLNTQTNDLRAILEQLPTAISRIKAYIEDGALTGAAYTAHKTYLRDGHLPFLRSLQNGLIQYIEANGAHTRIIDAKLPHSNYNQGIIRETLQWLDRSIRELNDMINVQQQHHLIQLRNMRMHMRRDWQDRLTSLEVYLSLTNSIYNGAEAAIQIAATHLQRLEYAQVCPATGAYILPTDEELFIRILEDEIAYLIANPEKVTQLTDARRREIIDYITEKYRGQNVTEIPQEERELLVKCYEFNNPVNTRVIEIFLEEVISDGNHEEDVLNIKYISYASPEPYHSVFFKYLPELTLACYTSPIFGEMSIAGLVWVDLDSDPDKKKGMHDPRGAYATFFHEIGHGIDYAMSVPGRDVHHSINNTSQSVLYGGMGPGNNVLNLLNPSTSSSLNNLVYADVENKIRQEIESVGNYPQPLNTADQAEVQAILVSLMKGGTMDSLNPLYEKRAKIQDVFGRQADGETLNVNGILYGPDNSGASDVYWGVTGQNISGNYGHSQFGYWTFFKPSTEFFAHSFGVNITQYTAPLDSMNTLFPSASSAFLEIMSNDGK